MLFVSQLLNLLRAGELIGRVEKLAKSESHLQVRFPEPGGHAHRCRPQSMQTEWS